LFKEGDKVDIGILLCEIEDDPQAVPFQGTAAAPLSSDAKTEVVKRVTVEAPKTEKTEKVEKVSELKRHYTPLVKVMAKKAGISLAELESIPGSGTAGRITKEDFENYVSGGGKKTLSPSFAAAPAVAATVASVVFSARDEVVPMDHMRKIIARNMVISKQTSAHVSSVGEVDMSHIVKFRESFKNEFMKQEGFNLTYTPFIMKAIISALKDYPKLNASIDGENVIFHKDIHLGLAVSVGKGEGLVVPVVKNADTLSMLGLCRKVNELALKARSKKLSMDDLQGGTYTFTNVGSFEHFCNAYYSSASS
jgi:2-oxoglutarate dehydrogenase E2 component (dihydrolipoamide succinyltransferase)